MIWVDELPALVRLAADCGIDVVNVSHVIAYNDYWRDRHPSTEPERTDAAMLAALDEARRLSVGLATPRLFGTGEPVLHDAPPRVPIGDMAPIAPPPEGRKYWCRYAWRELFVSLGGVVSPCCGIGRPDVGNVNTDGDLRTLFRHPTLVEMRAGMIDGNLHPACASCPMLAMYSGLDYGHVRFEDEYHALQGALRAQRENRSGCGGGDARR